MTKVNTSFYWKFSRDGDYNETYLSFIIDVPQTNISLENNFIYFQTTFNSLSMILLLLQEVEIFNNKQGQRNAGLNKKSFLKQVNMCGYNPDFMATEKRNNMNLVEGTAVMGKHKGFPIDWGFYNDTDELIKLNITRFNPVRNVKGENGLCNEVQDRDLLACFRLHSSFNASSNYWDFMPRHIHMSTIFNAMKSHNTIKADEFVKGTLGWSDRNI